MTTILKSTSKGQITIPAKWRKQFDTDQYIATVKDSKMEIRPLMIEDAPRQEYTVFDAIRDNKGKGIRAEDLVRILKELESE